MRNIAKELSKWFEHAFREMNDVKIYMLTFPKNDQDDHYDFRNLHSNKTLDTNRTVSHPVARNIISAVSLIIHLQNELGGSQCPQSS